MRLLQGQLGLGLSVAVLALLGALPSCGDDDDGDDKGSAGSAAGAGSPPGGGGAAAGVGGRAMGGSAGASSTVACGTALCQPLTVPTLPPVPACCADAATSTCGIDTTLLGTFGAMPMSECEPLAQPGTRDTNCPDSPPFDTGQFQLPAFRGCCRAETNQCGFLIDSIQGLIPIGLGCVDSAPFLEGGAPLPCGSAAP